MSQNTSSASKIEQVDLKCNSLSDEGDNDVSGPQRPSETTRKTMETKGRDSKEKKAEWDRFFAELEIWHRKRYERLIETLKEIAPHLEIPPRIDKDWRNLTYNRPREILLGIAPPLPPGFPPLSLEEVIEKGKQKERIRKEQERKLRQPKLDPRQLPCD